MTPLKFPAVGVLEPGPLAFSVGADAPECDIGMTGARGVVGVVASEG